MVFNRFWRRHKRGIFVALLFAVPLLPVFLIRFDLPNLNIYDRVVAHFVLPVARAFDYATGGVGVIWRDYITLVGTSKNNEKLKAEVAEKNQQILDLQEAGFENQRLRKLLNIPGLDAYARISAKIVGQDSTGESIGYFLNAGSDDGVELRMPVISRAGVVGSIRRVFARASYFVAVQDPSHHVDGVVMRSRAKFLVEGMGATMLGRLKYLDRAEDVRVGDTVLTSGLDGVFPKGLPIGTVVRVERPRAGVMQESELRAAVDLGELEEVLILKAPASKAEALNAGHAENNPKSRESM